MIGVEPTTCWLQVSCSAIEPHQQNLYKLLWRPGRDSNPRPPAWQAGILTSWTTRPHKNLNGGTNRARTCDPLLVRQVLSQLSYGPILVTHRGIEPLLPPWKGGVLTAWPMSHDIKFTGCGGRTWTSDLRVMSPTSCQLLHSAMLNMVPKTGIEPVREYKSRRILSPVRLPVPPLRQLWLQGRDSNPQPIG